MPLSELQQRVFRLLAANRSPDSYIAGATVLNAAPESPRYSQDINIFHDAVESVAQSAEADAATLNAHGYRVEWKTRQPNIWRAFVWGSGDEMVGLDWVVDSAFRFFPIEKDDLVGYRLNFWDAATNKVLAFMGRREARDYLDVLHLHEHTLSLGALAWAAAGKDPGINPMLILNLASRLARYQREEFADLVLAAPLDFVALKQIWLRALEHGRELVTRLPAEEVGCLYLNAEGQPVEPDPAAPGWNDLRRHFGSVKGAWPVVRE